MVAATSSFGFGGTASSFLVFQSLERTRDIRMEQLQRDPLIKRDIAYFLEHVQEIETVEEFFEDRRLVSVALSAFSLDEEINFPARIKKVMTDSLEDPKALANVLIDPRFKEIAEAFDFATLGVGRLKLNSFRQEVIDKFLVNEFEKQLGRENPALREAEFFRRKIGDANSSLEILGNTVLRNVTTFTLGLPKEIVFQSIQKQQDLIDARLDIADFKDPEKVDKFVRRFLILTDNEAIRAGSAGTDPILQLLQGANRGFNFLV